MSIDITWPDLFKGLVHNNISSGEIPAMCVLTIGLILIEAAVSV